MGPLDQYPELAAAADRLPAHLLGRVAERLVALGVSRTNEHGLSEASVTELRERVDALDTAAFDLRDRVDKGETGQMEAYETTFRRARAVDSWLALRRHDTDRAIYEAMHALGADEELVLTELEAAAESG